MSITGTDVTWTELNDTPFADPECSADYYLVCLASENNRYEPLFKHIRKDTIK